MGPTSRLDLVEYPSDAGGAASYDVFVHTAFRLDARFVERCAQTPGHAANVGHDAKLNTQYTSRLPGARLVPLTAEVGGPWHPGAVRLLRQLTRKHVARTPGLDATATGAVVARWAARLSATPVRGNAAVERAAWADRETLRVDGDAEGVLGHQLPLRDCAYELLVR